jgi:hypothetical protein
MPLAFALPGAGVLFERLDGSAWALDLASNFYIVLRELT